MGCLLDPAGVAGQPSASTFSIMEANTLFSKEEQMSLKNLVSRPILDARPTTSRATAQGHPSGHSHFWERARLSRRDFLGAAAAVAAASRSILAFPSESAPRPIPGGSQFLGPGTEVFHVFPLAPGDELSTITDFNGVVGAAVVDGTWSGGGVTAPPGVPLVFDTDMRFMKGEYVGVDGNHHQGAFVFV